jgi:branched-chain amino acid transport system substrate-binding protein
VPGFFYLAALLPFEGSWPVGEAAEHAILQAILEINRLGGIRGEQLGFVLCNTRGDADTAAKLMREVAGAGLVSAVIGPMESASFQAAADVASDQGITLISPGSSTLNGASDWVKRLAPSVGSQALVAAKVLEREGVSSALMIHSDDPDGNALGKAFVGTFAARGRAASQATYKSNEPDFARKAITSALGYGPMAVVLVAPPADGASIVRAAANRSFQPHWLFFPKLRTEQFVDSVADSSALEGALGLAAEDPTRAENAVFTVKFHELWGEAPEPFSAQAYDATYLIGIAMALASDPDDRAQVRDQLANTSTGQTVGPGEWDRVLEQASSGSVNYDGVSGPADLDSSGEVGANLAEWRIESGRFETVVCYTPQADICE